MQRNDEVTKKPYERPEIKRFPLRPHEAVLGFCKSATANGPGGFNSCNNPTPCRTLGS
jgi:hypothetical protein